MDDATRRFLAKTKEAQKYELHLTPDDRFEVQANHPNGMDLSVTPEMFRGLRINPNPAEESVIVEVATGRVVAKL